MNITCTKRHKTNKEANYAKLHTKQEAKSMNKSHKFWCLQITWIFFSILSTEEGCCGFARCD